MQNQSSSNEMQPFDPSDAWTRFGHAKVIKKWAGELLAALAAGADHFIAKPVTPAALARGLDELIRAAAVNAAKEA